MDLIPTDILGLIRSFEDMINLLKVASTSTATVNIGSELSPIEPLIEIAIDLLISLSIALREDFKGIVTPNPSLEFSERWSDPLGNPLQIKRFPRHPFILGPDKNSAMYCRRVAEYLVLLRRSLQVDFHGQLWEPDLWRSRFKMARDFHKRTLRELSELMIKETKRQEARHAFFYRKNAKNKRQFKKFV